ncbi:MAG: 50S ribosomal protein L3, partial [Candidatus Omnitrophota bacterium]|nr:50S ribosomal protein L3 [Candidatus Omnitrophota bacterium]
MSKGLLGKKIGMMNIFAEDGKFLGVTVIEAGPCPVLAVKQNCIQLGFDLVKETRVNKPLSGYFKKRNIAPRKFIRELLKDTSRDYNVGEELKADLFKPGDYVDIIGT